MSYDPVFHGAPPAPSRRWPRTSRAGTKLEQFIKMLRRPKGVSIKEASEALDWMQHSVRGAVAGALKKTYRMTILSEKVQGRGTVYRLKV
jgi:hypothetical protein